MTRAVAYVGIIKNGSQPEAPDLIERYKLEIIRMYAPEALLNHRLRVGYWPESANISQQYAVVCATLDFNNAGEQVDFDKYELRTSGLSDTFGNNGIILVMYDRVGDLETLAETDPDFQLQPAMVAIPSGKFEMGSTWDQAEEAFKGEGGSGTPRAAHWEVPQHTVELPAYSIGKYPVVNRQYRLFISETNHTAPKHWENGTYPAVKALHPVVGITYTDAKSYCEWLSENTGRPFRLPSEAEWEKAARGTDGRIWPWGNEFGYNHANTYEMSIRATTPVGLFSPRGDSPYGCVDMIGNVRELCGDGFSEDDYKERRGKEVSNPRRPVGYDVICRGGSYTNLLHRARCAFRDHEDPLMEFPDVGFRIALPA